MLGTVVLSGDWFAWPRTNGFLGFV